MSVGPDQVPHSVASDLVHVCLSEKKKYSNLLPGYSYMVL